MKRRAFTLIELLVVIAIIGILATLVITNLASAQVKARIAVVKSDVTAAGQAVEVFKADPDNTGGYVILTPNSFDVISGKGAFIGRFATIFTSTQVVDTTTAIGSLSTSTYAVKFSKTAGVNWQYAYGTNPAGTDQALGVAGYSFWANTVSQQDTSDTLCVKNGTFVDAPSAQAQALCLP